MFSFVKIIKEKKLIRIRFTNKSLEFKIKALRFKKKSKTNSFLLIYLTLIHVLRFIMIDQVAIIIDKTYVKQLYK